MKYKIKFYQRDSGVYPYGAIIYRIRWYGNIEVERACGKTYAEAKEGALKDLDVITKSRSKKVPQDEYIEL